MNKDGSISEREFELINIIADGIAPTQRELSSRAGISLGMTNLLIKRLVMKGFLRVRQLNEKKVEYLLTPRGFSEKAKKSYRYTLKTLNSLVAIKDKIRVVLTAQLATGITELILLGKGDWHDLVELAVRGLPDPVTVRVVHTGSIESVSATGKALILYAEEFKEMKHPSLPTLNLVEALSNGPIEKPRRTTSEPMLVERN